MFCQRCGEQNADNSVFCKRCGNALQADNTSQPQEPQSQEFQPQGQDFQPQGQDFQPQGQVYQPQAQGYQPQAQGYQPQGYRPEGYQPQSQYYAPQSAYAGYAPQAPKKSKLGLILGLVAGAVVVIVAAIILVVLLTGGNSIEGYWYSDEYGDVIEFTDDGKINVYTYEEDYKGVYDYDESKNEGIISVNDVEYDFTVKNDKITLDDSRVYKRAADDFDLEEFVATWAGDNVDTLEETTPTPSPSAVVESVSDMNLTLQLSIGSYTGTYTGEMANSLPQGYGTFSSSTSDGYTWYYEGQWEAGHFYGDGYIYWDDGFSEGGWYENDYLNGEGWESWYGVTQYQGTYLDGEFNGQGTLYNQNGSIIYSGTFSYGYIQESAEARTARIDAIKAQSYWPTYDDLYNVCYNSYIYDVLVYGEAFDIYYYPEDYPTFCDFLVYMDGVEETGTIIRVTYWLSEGEPVPYEGQYVTVCGETTYLYSYTSNDGDYLTVPQIEAFSVE